MEQSTGNVLHKRDPYAQARTALEIVAHGLEALGATLEDVVSGNGALVAVDGLCKGCLRAAGSAASGTVTVSAWARTCPPGLLPPPPICAVVHAMLSHADIPGTPNPMQIRTRVYLRNMGRDSAAVSRAHGEVFGAIRPASSMIEVQRLVHDDILVLIEVDAIVS